MIYLMKKVKESINMQAPILLKINDIEYPLNSVNESRVKKRLLAKYPPETLVEEWVDGEHINTIRLDGIFTK